MKPASKLFSDITKSVGSGGIQFVITLLTTPLMTRLYDPAAYAAFSIVHAMAALIVGIGLVSMPHAYLTEKEATARATILRAMLLLLMVMVVLATLGAFGIAYFDLLHVGTAALILLPILVLASGIRQLLTFIATAHTHFGSIALGQIIEPVFARGGSIALGALMGGHPAWILMMVIVGHCSAAGIIVKRMGTMLVDKWRVLRSVTVQPLPLLRRYYDFILYSTASQQAKPLALFAIQLGIATFFSHQDAGHYILATSILTLPVTLIALTSAPVVYRHFIELEKNDAGALAPYIVRASLLYLLVGIVVFSPIFLFGEEIFSFAFGHTWAVSGTIASTLSLAYVGHFTVVGVYSIFLVTKRLKTLFWLELVLCSLVVCAATACFSIMDFYPALQALMIILLAWNSILLVACVATAYHHRHRAISS